MNRIATAVCMVGLLAASANATNIAFWHFDDQTNLGTSLYRINPLGTTDAKTEYSKDIGTGAAEISVWGDADVSEGNLVGTNGVASGSTDNNFGSFQGNTLNDIRDPQNAGGSLSIIGTSNNSHYFLIELDDVIQNCVLSYATRGTATGYDTHTLDYSTDNGATWHARESHAANKTATWAVHTVAFGDVFNQTSGHESNLIRMTVSGATGTSGNNRFDNILVTGTIVPEPAALALLAFGGLFLRRRRA